MAGIYSLTGTSAIERGACYSFTADIGTSSGEYPITDYTFYGPIRRKWDNNLEAVWSYELLTPASGIVKFSLTAAQTSGLSAASLEHEIYARPPNSGCPLRIIVGDVDVQGGGAY